MNTGDTYPKVSVIMTTFNRAAYILESVQSVQEQSYPNWELIIVDDGSEDNTEELIAGLNDKRIVFHKAGKIGLGIKLKSIGIERSAGELIAFIDSDDLWVQDKLEKQVAAMRAFPGAGFSITGGYNFIRKNEPLEFFYKQRSGYKCGNIFLSFFRSEASVFPQAMMIRRECLPMIERYVNESPGSDVDFLLGLALHYEAVIVYEPLICRRLHPGSFSARNWEYGYEEGVEVINRYRQGGYLPDSDARNSLFRLYVNYGQSHYSLGNKRKAIRMFWHAWRYKTFSMVPLRKAVKVVMGL